MNENQFFSSKILSPQPLALSPKARCLQPSALFFHGPGFHQSEMPVKSVPEIEWGVFAWSLTPGQFEVVTQFVAIVRVNTLVNDGLGPAIWRQSAQISQTLFRHNDLG